MRRGPLCAFAMFLAAGLAPAWSEVQDAAPPASRAILQRAFQVRYEVDLTSVIDLTMRNQLGQERHRRFRAMSKRIDDRVHSIGRLVEPEYLRGMTVLTIEAGERGHDAFLYLPSLDRVRRVSTAQRGDAFFGTDVTYEDLERRRASDYELEPARGGRFAGEEVFVVSGRPVRPHDYDRVRFAIAVQDYAILEVRYFKRGSDEPYRVIEAQRGSMRSQDGHVVPTRLAVTNRARGTHTDVVMRELRINPPIDDHAFSLKALESRRRLAVEGAEP